MKIEQYKVEAGRTMAPPEQWYLDTFDGGTTQLHCAMGIVTEFGELMDAMSKDTIDYVNIMEECADCFWYLAGFQRQYQELDWEEVEVLPHTDLGILTNVGMLASIEVLDMFKKWAYYGRTLDEGRLKAELYTVYRSTYTILKKIGFTVEEARQKNIDKLRARYPEKFTTENAIDRDLKTERGILEN